VSRRPVREAALVLAGGALAGGGVWVLFFMASYRARPDLCAVAGLVAAAGWRLVRSTVVPPESSPEYATPREEPGDGFDELASLEHRLSWGSVDADRFALRVRPLLAGIAADRLLSRHGIDARRRPDLARRIVGEPLWELMNGPRPTRAPSRAELTRLVEGIERI
jgi:hypothetical protein